MYSVYAHSESTTCHDHFSFSLQGSPQLSLHILLLQRKIKPFMEKQKDTLLTTIASI